MPKVGKIEIKFRKDEPCCYFDLYYSHKEKFYIKGIPVDFVRLPELVSSGHSTEESLRTHLRECLQIYQEELNTERDVSLYKISASSFLRMNEVNENHFVGDKEGVSKRISDIGGGVPKCCFGIEYNKCKEIDKGGKKYYPYKQSGALGYEMRVEKSWNIIEWTPEREEFFKSMYSNMENFIAKLSLFFTNDDEDVIKRIDSSGGNLKLIQA